MKRTAVCLSAFAAAIFFSFPVLAGPASEAGTAADGSGQKTQQVQDNPNFAPVKDQEGTVTLIAAGDDLIHANIYRRAFRPEFLNRLDETILFRPLTKENLNGIIDIMVASLRSRLADRSLELTITDSAKSLIIDRGFDPLYGARPLRRYLQSSVETLIARRILSGDVAPESTIVVDAENGELICR